ncbi:hypothetical protein F4775DRAFT_597683 [Biscogniauxia sp. FL1348]|nr:hypothetical protein F4775DRAFT_597683 [Biscogniauxia sp. FL1348]
MAQKPLSGEPVGVVCLPWVTPKGTIVISKSVQEIRLKRNPELSRSTDDHLRAIDETIAHAWADSLSRSGTTYRA